VYDPAITTAALKSGDVAVYLESRRAGTIIRKGGGFAYVPVGQKRSDSGEILGSVKEVLRTLGEESNA
jgi:hypothetical protein